MSGSDDDVLACALDYAELGWHVVPITPGRKHPPLPNWPAAATTDAEVIKAWFGDLYADHGVGIVTGPASGLWVLDVDGDEGEAALDQLVADHGPLPPTLEVETGSGGRHLYYAWEEAWPVGNNQSGRVAAHVDVRGAGGQVLAPPTRHPGTGRPYRWVTAGAPARAPRWLLERVIAERAWAGPPPPLPATNGGEDSAAAAFNASTTWDALLARDGWTLAGTMGSGEQRWTRPGKSPRDGISATVGHNGNDCLKVFSSSVPELRADEAYSRFGYEAAVRGVSRSQLAREIRARLNEDRRTDAEDWSMLVTAPAPVAPVNGNGHRPADHDVVTSAGVHPERVQWLWKGWLPLGKLAMLDGDPDLGKSTMSLDFAARLSSGRPMPDGQLCVDPCDVLVMSAEDGLADTIVPRLAAAGADLTRVHVWVEVTEPGDDGRLRHRPPTLPGDLARLEGHIRTFGVRLVLIDVLSAYLGGNVNAYHDQDVRRVLHALAAVATRTNCVILSLRHLNKSGGTKAIYRGGGSIAIVGAARTGLVVARDPDDENRSVLAVVKNNLAVKPKALSYQIAGDDRYGCGRINWLGQSHHSADALMAGPLPEDAEDRPRAIAEAFLREILAEGPQPVQTIKAEATQAGVAWRTVRRAQADLGITPVKRGRPNDREQWWEWGLPLPEDGHDPRRCSPRRGEHLRDGWTPSGESDSANSADSDQDDLGI